MNALYHQGMLISLLAALVGLQFGCQQGRFARADRPGVYHPPDGIIGLDGRPSKILVHEDRLYVTSFQDRKLWVLDAATGSELGRFEDFDSYVVKKDERDEEGNIIEERRTAAPGSLALVGGKLFVDQVFRDSLLVLDAEHLKPIARIPSTGSSRLLASRDGASLFLAGSHQWSIIDVETLSKRDIPYPEGARGVGCLAASPDGSRLYLGLQRGAREAGAEAPSAAAGPVNPLEQTFSGPLLAVVDLATEETLALKSIGDTIKARGDDSSIPSAMAFSADGQTLYVAMRQCMVGVHVFDTATNSLRKPISFASVHSGFFYTNSSGIACRDGELFVSLNANNELVILNARSHAIKRVVSFGANDGGPGILALSSSRLLIVHQALRRLFYLDM